MHWPDKEGRTQIAFPTAHTFSIFLRCIACMWSVIDGPFLPTVRSRHHESEQAEKGRDLDSRQHSPLFICIAFASIDTQLFFPVLFAFFHLFLLFASYTKIYSLLLVLFRHGLSTLAHWQSQSPGFVIVRGPGERRRKKGIGKKEHRSWSYFPRSIW